MIIQYIYSCNINLQIILKDLKYDMQNILKWFKVNLMKANETKEISIYDTW